MWLSLSTMSSPITVLSHLTSVLILLPPVSDLTADAHAAGSSVREQTSHSNSSSPKLAGVLCTHLLMLTLPTAILRAECLKSTSDASHSFPSLGQGLVNLDLRNLSQGCGIVSVESVMPISDEGEARLNSLITLYSSATGSKYSFLEGGLLRC